MLNTLHFFTVYLHRVAKNCQENRPVIYLDETWANAHDDKDCDWVERDDVTGETFGGIKRPPGKGCTAYYSWSWLCNWLDSQYHSHIQI